MEISLANDTLWIDILIPIMIGPIFLMIKVLYDRWDFKKRETAILTNKLNLEKIQKKLNDFYWPLYILLMKDFHLWCKLSFNNDKIFDKIAESDSESENEDAGLENYIRCSYIYTDPNGIMTQCPNAVAENCVNRFGSYCIKHYHHNKQKLLEVTETNILQNQKSIYSAPVHQILINHDDTVIVEDTKQSFKDFTNRLRSKNKTKNLFRKQKKKDEIIINIEKTDLNKEDQYDHEIPLIPQDDSDVESFKTQLSEDCNEVPGNLTGNRIGEIEGLNVDSTNNSEKEEIIDFHSEMKNELTNFIIENHDKINEIIIGNIAIAEPKKNIGKQLFKFIKFINIFKSQYLSKNMDINPAKYGAPYPKKLLPMIEIQVFKLQREYSDLVANYYDF